MVIHDKEQEQQWAQKRQEQSRKETLSSRKPPRRLSVVAVQSLACIALILVGLLFRVAGGEAYTQLQHRFADALADNELMSALMQLWDPDPTEGLEDVKWESFTESQPAE